jgi:hypothetical protein
VLTQQLVTTTQQLITTTDLVFIQASHTIVMEFVLMIMMLTEYVTSLKHSDVLMHLHVTILLEPQTKTDLVHMIVVDVLTHQPATSTRLLLKMTEHVTSLLV